MRHAYITTTAGHYTPVGEERTRGTLTRAVGEVPRFSGDRPPNNRR